MSEFTSEELDRAEFYFDDDTQDITIIVRYGNGHDQMSFEQIENKKEYFKRKLMGK